MRSWLYLLGVLGDEELHNLAWEQMTQHLNLLEQRIRDVAETNPFALHWQVRDLTSGDLVGQSERTVLGSFSTRKVSVLLACLALVKSEKLNLTTGYVISPELKDGVQAGVMRNLSSGVELSLQDHLAQMMITSDNICTQIIFQAIEEATGDALQWINDYCSQLGLHDTLHREVFPRSAELSWSHSTDTMTVTSAHDQALLLELLARGCSEESTAIDLGLDSKLCVFAVELMSHLFTPLLGARVARGRFAEKNGRGIRGLSQVGILLDDQDQPVASVAFFAEAIPVELIDGTPGRARAIECFVKLGELLEEFFLDGTPSEFAQRQVIEPDYWEQEYGELLCAVEGGRAINEHMVFPFSGVGKLFFAHTLVALEDEHPGLFDNKIEITSHHRAMADSGPLRFLTGTIQLTVDDAVALMLQTGDGAATMGLLGFVEASGINIIDDAHRVLEHLENTTVTGLEDRSMGEGFIGTTTAADILTLLRQIIDNNGRLKTWMSAVFEPAGLANALPGYGPHTVEHWTVSGWARIYSLKLDQGRTSALILQCADRLVGLTAHAPVGTQDVSAKFGSLGLSTLVRT